MSMQVFPGRPTLAALAIKPDSCGSWGAGGVFEYEGEWHRGMKHGHGIFRTADVGQFKARAVLAVDFVASFSVRVTQPFFAGLRL